MKTIAEIKDKIKSDINDPVQSTMIGLCDGIHPLMLFVSDYYKDEFKNDVLQLTRENIISEMQGYIDFAFKKAYAERGISAERSVWKFKQWIWALGDFDVFSFEYNDYGVDLLETIASKYDLIVEESE